MNYVIQNYFNNNYLINYTPRLTLFFFLKNLNFFLLTFIGKLNQFSFKNKPFSFNFYKFFFVNFFFTNKLIRFLNKTDFEILHFHSNKISKSYFFWILRLIKFFFFEKQFFHKNFNKPSFCNNFTNNLFILPFVFTNKIIFNYLFKNIFFYFFTLCTDFFFNTNLFLKHRPNHLVIFPSNELQIFFKGYFFNIYNL